MRYAQVLKVPRPNLYKFRNSLTPTILLPYVLWPSSKKYLQVDNVHYLSMLCHFLIIWYNSMKICIACNPRECNIKLTMTPFSFMLVSESRHCNSSGVSLILGISIFLSWVMTVSKDWVSVLSTDPNRIAPQRWHLNPQHLKQMNTAH